MGSLLILWLVQCPCSMAPINGHDFSGSNRAGFTDLTPSLTSGCKMLHTQPLSPSVNRALNKCGAVALSPLSKQPWLSSPGTSHLARALLHFPTGISVFHPKDPQWILTSCQVSLMPFGTAQKQRPGRINRIKISLFRFHLFKFHF